MTKYLIIEGRVVGGHRLGDLGVEVPYEGEVVLIQDRASWSRDLSQALNNGEVIKKRVVTARDLDEEQPPRRRTATKQPSPPPRPKQKSKPKPETSTGQSEKLAEDNDSLRRMNQSLMETTERLLQQQEKLLEKMNEYMDRPPAIGVTPSHPSENPQERRRDDQDDNADTPTFVPSQIRSGRVKASRKVAVEEGTRSGKGNFSDAAAALKAFRDSADEDGGDSDSE